MFVFVVRSSSAWTLRCCVAVIGMSGCCVPQDMQKQCNNFDCIGSWSKCTCLGGAEGSDDIIYLYYLLHSKVFLVVLLREKPSILEIR